MGRLIRIGTGYTLIAAGTVMLVVPGPGLITIAGGLAMLSEDVEWAGKATDWLKSRTGRSRPEEAAGADSDQAGG
ncbi:MAG TPA: PGPGW domain-containing protein [Acidimicrobiia bacterium]|jgi:Putative transmembrane protein (PGPGW)